VEWYHVCWPRLTAKRVEPVVSISWASCYFPRCASTAVVLVLCPTVCLSHSCNASKCLNVLSKAQSCINIVLKFRWDHFRLRRKIEDGYKSHGSRFSTNTWSSRKRHKITLMWSRSDLSRDRPNGRDTLFTIQLNTDNSTNRSSGTDMPYCTRFMQNTGGTYLQRAIIQSA